MDILVVYPPECHEVGPSHQLEPKSESGGAIACETQDQFPSRFRQLKHKVHGSPTFANMKGQPV